MHHGGSWVYGSEIITGSRDTWGTCAGSYIASCCMVDTACCVRKDCGPRPALWPVLGCHCVGHPLIVHTYMLQARGRTKYRGVCKFHETRAKLVLLVQHSATASNEIMRKAPWQCSTPLTTAALYDQH